MPLKNPELEKQRKLKYYYTHRDAVRAQQAEYRNANKETARKYGIAYRKANAERCKQWRLDFVAKNPEKKRAYVNAYRRRLKQQMPLWANKQKICELYYQASCLNLTIDHVIPLKGKLVCGLHVENNLQLLSREDNSKKHNMFQGETD